MSRAGAMRDRVQLLTLTETDAGFAWTPSAERWAEVIPGKTSIFSRVAMAARAVTLRMRADRTLTLSHAIRLHGQHLFLTRITPESNRLYLQVETAAVRLSACAVTRTRLSVDNTFFRPTLGEKTVVEFPAVLSEKYLTNRQDIPQTTTTDRMVLTCPKPVELQVGEIVTVDGAKYEVAVRHELDPDRNDYEIERKEDA